MMYDITMCNGGRCTRRDTCHRWLQYQRYKADNGQTKPMYISMHLPTAKCRGDNCTLYWEEPEKEEI